MLHLSFRLKIIVWYSTVALLTLFLFRLISIGVIRQWLYEELGQSLIAEIEFTRDMVDELKGHDRPDEEIRQEVARRSSLNPRKELIEIYDIKGAEYFRSPNLENTDTLRVLGANALEQAITVHNARKESIRVIGLKDSSYELYVAYPLTDIEEAIDKILSSFFVLIPITLLLLAGGGLFLVSRFIQPIQELNRYTDRLIQASLDQELPKMSMGRKDEIGELVEKIYEVTQRMRNSLRHVLSFSSLTSHELRTPLSVLRSQLEQALHPKASAAHLRRVIASTYDEILHLNRIVNDLLTFSKMEAGTFTLDLQPVAFHSLLQEFCDEAMLLTQEKNISLILNPGPPVFIEADTGRIRQMLFNLLDNAIKHTAEHGQIHLSYETQDQELTFRFADTGTGIPAPELSKIFDLFYRGTSNGSDPGGTGLGLPLVKWIVEAHHGPITVQSEPGHGTTFSLKFPLLSSSPG